MIIFWVFAIAMVVIALFFIFRPLLLGSNKNDIDRTAQNVAITKERLNELKVELEQSTITQAEYDQTKEELEQALLNDVEESSGKTKSVNNQSYTRLTRYVLMFSVPVFAISLYAYLGQPELIEGNQPPPAQHSQATAEYSMDEVLVRLEQRLAKNPEDKDGLMLLGRTYMSMKRYTDAAKVFGKVISLVGDNPIVLLAQADALAMEQGGRLSGKPAELVKKAIKQSPNNLTGLWLSGLIEEEQGNDQQAIAYWRKAEKLLSNDPGPLDELRGQIRRVEARMGVKQVTETDDTAPPAAIVVKVALAEQFKNKVQPDDTVFIYARAEQGVRMPLAIVRKRVADLPLQVTLDDTSAMLPQMALSKFKQVNITARISRTGQAISQNGDLIGEVKQVKTHNSEEISVTIDHVFNK